MSGRWDGKAMENWKVGDFHWEMVYNGKVSSREHFSITEVA